ncbi:MAG: hypothetical protein WD607_06010 [Candidatus Paceibacterota bacterium]
MSNINLEIADREIREIVNSLRKNGFPEEISLKEAMKNMEKEKKEILSSLVNLSEKEKELDRNPHICTKNSKLWNLREEIRDKLREALKLGMANLGIIKRQLVSYGAIPSPEENWKYYYLPNLDMACWTCGDKIRVKSQTVSIHDGLFAISGSGRVSHKQVPYCPTCNAVPPDSSIEKVDPIESIIQDIAGLK